jgi:hypothetical protein
MKKSRGRPPSQQTIERHRIIEMLKNPPQYINQAEVSELHTIIKSLDEAERKMLGDYKSYPTISHSHIFEMALICCQFRATR